MSGTRIRFTAVIAEILDCLVESPVDDPPWGLRLCEQTGFGTGTTYPALDRLMKAGWIEATWEDPPPPDRPRRRYYRISSAGRAALEEENAARAARRARWTDRALPAGGTA
jgi:PadR family transcriptional regulator, regulatory protein PadR